MKLLRRKVRTNGRLARALGFVLVMLLATGIATLAAPQERSGEVVATLATGRVIFCVTRDAIVVAAASGGGEVGSRAPAIVPIRADFIGVLLGATEWSSPDSGAMPTRLDAELKTIAANAIRHTGKPNPNDPSEIEDIGVAMLETLRPFVTQIHHKLDLTQNEPLLELLLSDYAPNYGPEIWSLQYRIRQEDLGNGYWKTTILRPGYYQLYPPEKGQPRTFVEVRYPASSAEPTLASRVQEHDQQFERVRNSSPEMTKAIGLVNDGNSVKASSGPLTDFLRAVLPMVVGQDSNMTLAVVDAERGFQWILAPQEKLPPPTTKPIDPDKPSLRNPRVPSP